MSYLLQTKDLTKFFKKKAAINKVSLNVKGTFTVYRQEWCWKTTFIRVVAGLARPNSGEIKLLESDNLDLQRSKVEL